MIDVRASEATVPSDKAMILGLIETHGGIDAMEGLVRGVVHWALQAARKFEQLGYTHNRAIRGSDGSEKTFDARGAGGGAWGSSKLTTQAAASLPNAESSQGSGAEELVRVALKNFELMVRPCYEVEKSIGSYSQTALASDTRSPGSVVLIRKLARWQEDEVDARFYLRELQLSCGVRGRLLATLTDAYVASDDERDLYFVTPQIGPTLAEVVRANKGKLTEEHTAYFMLQLLAALEHLHAAGCYHLDVKPEAIRADAQCNLQLCDFTQVTRRAPRTREAAPRLLPLATASPLPG